MKLRVSSLFVLLFVTISTDAADVQKDFDFRHFTTNDGLPHNYINSIFQDSDGFIWIGTRNGICRYDGYAFESIKSTLSDASVVDLLSVLIMESESNEIWSFGGSVITRYNGRTFEVYGDSYDFAYPDNKGNLWFVKDRVITCLDTANLHVLDDKSPGNQDLLRLIFKGAQQKRWVFQKFSQQQIINSSNGICKSFEIPYPEDETLRVSDIYLDSGNLIWISTSNKGLLWYDTENEEFGVIDHRNGLPSNNIHEVSEMSKDRLWIGSAEGLIILNRPEGSMKLIRNDLSNLQSLSDNTVTCFLKDRYGNIFVGTRYGMNLLQNRIFKHTFVSEGDNSILSNNVHGFLEDRDRNTWIITSGGISKLDVETGSFHNIRIDPTGENSLRAPPISIIGDDQNNLWLGTWNGGLYYFQTADRTFKAYKQNPLSGNSISSNNVMSLFRDSRNRLWVGTWGGGVNLFDEDTGRFIVFLSGENGESGLSGNEVSCFAEDFLGRIWIGTLDGLNLLVDEKNKEFRQFTSDRTFSSNQISALHSSGEYLWVGTNYGLNKINVLDFSHEQLMEEDGLPSNRIKAIAGDDHGSLWVSTNKGLAKITFRPGEKQLVERIFSFTPADGLQDNEFLERSVLNKANGELLFGGTNGFNSFHPDQVLIDSIAPVCEFTRLYVDEKEILVGDTVHGIVSLQDRLSRTEKIQLSYKQNSFAIEFAGLYFSKPGEISYKYMLQGFDENWKTTDSKNRVATYTNLNTGRYQLVVNASNSNGYWGNTPIRMDIEVIPPFWNTAWFRILLYLTLALLILLIIEIRINIIRNQKTRLENTVRERTSEILKQKEEIKSQADQIRQMNNLLKRHNIELKDSIESLSKARVMQKLLDYKEFKKIFKSENACRQYLIEMKWGQGYHCARCNGTDYRIEDNQARRCKKCNYKESTTAGTIFHHLRFPLSKAFYILIVSSTGRKINISELSRTLDLRLKTTWTFHNKVVDEMKRQKTPIKSDKGWTSLIITSPTGKVNI